MRRAGVEETAVDPALVRATAKSFGLEWTRHGDLARLYASEDKLFEEFATYRIPSEVYYGKRVLDAGCGMGRYSYVLARLGARKVVGMDLHDGVHMAERLTRPLGTVGLVKGSLFAMPFRPEQFDAVVSIGVLHHTGDTFKALRNLLPLVRPGGAVFVQVYATRGAAKDRRSARLLDLTNRLPKQLLYTLCTPVVAAMYVPLLKNLVRLVNHFVPVVSFGKHRTFWRNVADTYDWHCCPFRTTHTPQEMHRVFQAAGLERIMITNPEYRGAVNILGWKSASPKGVNPA